MTAQDAYYWNAVRETRSRIVNDNTLNLWDKSKIVSQLDRLNARPAPDGRVPFKSVVNSLVGAGFGYGAAALGGKLLGLSAPAYSKLTTAGLGLGAFMNSGMVKLNSYTYADRQEDRVNAYRLGFLMRAKQAGYFDKQAAAPLFVVTPGDVGGMVGGASTAAKGFAGRVGSILGAVTSPNADDADLAKLEAEEDLLRQRLRELLASRKSNVLRDVLSKRRS